MYWLVQIALKKPYSVAVLAILILFMGVFSCVVTPTDVFPSIDIPVVSVIWSFNGLSPDEMAKRVVTVSERAMTTTVDDIEHIESQSLQGVAVIKVFFHPNVRIEAGVAQITSIMQTIIRALPPGMTPPLILQYSASSVPILQLGIGSKSLTEQQLFDYSTQWIRTSLATVQGAAFPLPYGGKARQIMVDLDPAQLQARGLSAIDVSNALNAQNLILPSGTAKMGMRDYNIRLNSSPGAVDDINNMPIKIVNGAMTYIKDVAQVHDGFAVQTNIVNLNGHRAALLTALKTGAASTLDVVARIKAALPRVRATLPPELNINLMFDQSVFVRAAVEGVIREAVIAAILTGFMILLFLGSWRSTLIVIISIPLAILSSIIILSAMGKSINVMTLGGLALAVGILVDDATVEIENMHRNLAMKKPLRRAILDGAYQIAVPTFVSTLSICVVFVSVVFLNGPARYLFVPLGLAVVFAMVSSYLLSRTLVPVMASMLLKTEVEIYQRGEEEPAEAADWMWALHHRFNTLFLRFRSAYHSLLEIALRRRRMVGYLFLLFFAGTTVLIPFVGEDFFPTVDAGQIRLHVRAPNGTRIEETDRMFNQVLGAIRQIIPAAELQSTLSNFGIPLSGINLAFTDTAPVGPNDGEILISLKADQHGPIATYMRQMRIDLHRKFPNIIFFFQPADIVNQILNFGLPAPIDIQVTGRAPGNYELARKIAHDVHDIPGAVDVHVHQVIDAPAMDIVVDRERAGYLGFTQANVAQALLISLSGSGQAAPSFWLDPKSGVQYVVAVQTPQRNINSIDSLMGTAVGNQILDNMATIHRSTMAAIVSHYNVQPVFDIYANVQDRDLGGVARDVNKVLARYEPTLAKGNYFSVRGQVDSMNSSFVGLGLGIVFAIVLVYLLMVVNFQSWVDPFIIIMALPGALAGVIWMLFLTQTTFNVESLMGTIMSLGVATANSILLVTFANERRGEGDSAFQAALTAGQTRLRPVMMTAAAMIIGMVPMALAFGQGGEQNAPLGRAVIGGLLCATFTTLFLVPCVYSVMRKHEVVAVVEEENA